MNINTAVSQNIRQIREQKKLTLDMAAQLTGVSRSMLAQIEKGDANPTISVLWKIANGYKVAFTALVEEKKESAVVIRGATEPALMEAEGTYCNYPAFVFDEKRGFETYRIVIAAGGQLEAQPHMLGTEEYITVFAGTVDVAIDGQVYTLCTGDSIRFLADVPHGYANHGMEQASLSMLLYYKQM